MAEYIERDKAVEKITAYCELRQAICINDKDEYLRGLQTALKAISYNDVIPNADVQPVNQWISVKDRLPDENQKCLVYRDIDDDLKITTGIWHSERKVFNGLRHGTRLEDTIAWMPLPEPPKEG